jgi:hypothetical protein
MNYYIRPIQDGDKSLWAAEDETGRLVMLVKAGSLMEFVNPQFGPVYLWPHYSFTPQHAEQPPQPSSSAPAPEQPRKP